MIRILAVSISAAALIAASLPASAQSRQQGPSFRSQPSFSGQQFRGQQQFRQQQFGQQRNFRSFNPPSPSGQRLQRSFNPPAPVAQGPGQVRSLSRGFNPPTPGVSQRSFGPQAPTGGRNFVGGPGSVPASLPAPSLGQSNPTAAPAGPAQEPGANPDLQAPIPETVTAQGPTQGQPETAPQQGQPEQPAAEMPATEGEQEMAAAPEGEEQAEGEQQEATPGRVVSKFAPTGKVYHKRVIKKVYHPHVVYQPVYVAKPVYVHRVYRHHHHHGCSPVAPPVSFPPRFPPLVMGYRIRRSPVP